MHPQRFSVGFLDTTKTYSHGGVPEDKRALNYNRRLEGWDLRGITPPAAIPRRRAPARPDPLDDREVFREMLLLQQFPAARKYRLEIGEIKTILLESASREQTITVKASSPGAPIDLHVYLPQYEEAIERKITLGKPPENLLASQVNAEVVFVWAVVPARQETVIRRP